MNMMSLLRLFLVLAVSFSTSAAFAQSLTLAASKTAGQDSSTTEVTAQKPQILLLGVAHFASTRNLQNPIVLNSLTPERQMQLQDLLDHLARFHPTKVAIEVPVDSTEIQPQYQSYLQGRYTLRNDERDQIGFRLARMLGHVRIYPVDYRMDLGFDAVVEYSQKHGQKTIFDQAISDPTLLNRINSLRSNGTLRNELEYLNTDEALKLNLGFYMSVARIGAGSDYPGADMTAEWYKRNLYIFSNLTRIATSKNDKILVIFGQGHIPLLKQFILASPDYSLANTEEYLR